jgi:hypothetical protein
LRPNFTGECPCKTVAETLFLSHIKWRFLAVRLLLLLSKLVSPGQLRDVWPFDKWPCHTYIYIYIYIYMYVYI